MVKIGTLVFGSAVLCDDCFDPDVFDGVPIDRANIGRYRQVCNICQQVLVEGATPAWPVLFDGKSRDRLALLMENPIPVVWPHGYCPHCDQPLDPSWEACGNCGRDLEREHEDTP